MSSTQQSTQLDPGRPSRLAEEIEVYGHHRAGPIKIEPASSGSVHISIGHEGLYLDRVGVDDLVHALIEAMGEAS